MSSTKRKIEIQGISPFKQASGVFEVQISISKEKPSEQSINAKNFETVWKDTVHLRVTGGKFSTVLGSGAKTLPDEVFKLDSIWIVILEHLVDPVDRVHLQDQMHLCHLEDLVGLKDLCFLFHQVDR